MRPNAYILLQYTELNWDFLRPTECYYLGFCGFVGSKELEDACM